MPTFEYQVQKPDGTIENGTAISSSLDSVVSDLAGKGLQVLRIGLATNANDPLSQYSKPSASTPVEKPSAQQVYAASNPYDVASPTEGSKSEEAILGQRSYVATSVVGPLVGQVPLTVLAFFFRQSSTMLKAGVPIVQSLNTLAKQAKNAKFQAVVTELAQHVEAGRPISYGMQRYPEVFSSIILSMVRAGEEGGFLDSALESVADYLDSDIKIRNLYRRVTFYPKLELGFSIIIVIATNLILGVVKPGAKGLESPLTNPITWVFLTPLIIGIFLFLRVGLANPRVKYNWDLFVSCIPFVGTTFRQLAMARFGRAFGALYHGGVPMTRALVLSADACGNEYLRARIHPVAGRLEQGVGITDTLIETGAFSPIVLDMVSTGERTGNLDHMLNKMSDFYSQEAETRSTQLGYVIGVLIGLAVAIYIGYVVITFWTTNYGPQITNAVENT